MSVDFPEHQPGTRPIHTKGIAVAGQFRATRDAKEYCIAPQFDGSWTPVVVRFSNGNGQPDPDGRLQPRGMAVKLYPGGSQAPDPAAEHQDQVPGAGAPIEEQPIVPAAPGGQIQETDLICMSVPVFMAQSAEGVLEFEKAYGPRRVRPPSLLKRLGALARMSPLPPQEAGVSMSGNDGFLQWARGFEPAQGFLLELSLQGLPASYARAVYHAVHAFDVEGADGTHRMVRFSFEPSDGVRNEGPPEPAQSPIALVPQAPTRERVRADAGSRLPPAGAPRPHHLRPDAASTSGCRSPTRGTTPRIPRRRGPSTGRACLMGTLFLSHVLTDQVASCEELSFNPGRLLPGMGPSDDPVLRQRVAVYEESYRRRMEARRQGCPVS